MDFFFPFSSGERAKMNQSSSLQLADSECSNCSCPQHSTEERIERHQASCQEASVSIWCRAREDSRAGQLWGKHLDKVWSSWFNEPKLGIT